MADNYFGGTPTEAYALPRYKNVPGDARPDVARDAKTAWQKFTESTEVTAFTSPFRAIGKPIVKGVGAVAGGLDNVTDLDFYKRYTQGVVGGYAGMTLSQVTQDKAVIDTYQKALEAETDPEKLGAEGPKYGIQPSLLSGIVGGFEEGVSTFVTRPLSTGFMLTDPDNPYRGKGNFVRDSWNRSEVVPFSRAMVANELGNYIPASVNPTSALTSALNFDEYDIYSDESMEAASNNPYYNVLTGAVQLGTEFTPVPLAPIKGAKAALGFKRTIDSVDDLNRVRTDWERHKAWRASKEDKVPESTYTSEVVLDDGIKPAQTPIGINVEKITRLTSADKIARNPLLKQMPSADTARLADVLARTNDQDTVFEIIMGMKGDMVSLGRLSRSDPDVMWYLGEGDAMRTRRLLNGEPYRPVGNDLDRVRQTFASSNARSEYFADVRALMRGRDAEYGEYMTGGLGGSRMPLTRGKGITGGFAPMVERVRGAVDDWVYRWQTRQFEGIEDYVTSTSVPRFPGGPVTQFVHWAGKRVPKGRVSISSTRPNDWITEFDAMMGEVPLFRPGFTGTPGVAVKVNADGTLSYIPGSQFVALMRERLMRASGERNLFAAYREVEEEIVYAMALTMTGNPKRAQAIVDEMKKASDEITEAESYLQTSKGLLVEQSGPAILYSPETLSMLAESFETIDMRKVFDLIKRYDDKSPGARKLAAAGDVTDSVIDIFDRVTAFFRTNVLLRPGYIPKNSMAEPMIASMIVHGTVLPEEGFVSAVRNFGMNRAQNARELTYRADVAARFKAKFTGEPQTEKQLKQAFDNLVNEYRQAQASLDEAIADLEAIKRGEVPPSMVPTIQSVAEQQLVTATKKIREAEEILSDVAPGFQSITPPASIAGVRDQLGELSAILGDDAEYVYNLRREAYEIERRAAAQSNRLLDDIDARIEAAADAADEAAAELDRTAGLLDEVSVAASGDSYTIVTYRDGSTRVLRGDRRELFSHSYRTSEVDAAGRRTPDADTGTPLTSARDAFPDLATTEGAASYALDSGPELRMLAQNLGPDDYITVYKAAPRNSPIQPGQFVSPFKRTYDYIMGREGIVLHEKRVRAGELYTDGNNVQEWGWSPRYQEDISGVEYRPGNPDGPTYRTAVDRDRRGMQARRRLDLAVRELEKLREERAKLMEGGYGALDNANMPASDKARLAAIDAKLSRVERFTDDQFKLLELIARPSAVRAVDDDVIVWNAEDFPGMFNLQERADALAVGDAFAGQPDLNYIYTIWDPRDGESLQDTLRDLWRWQAQPDGPPARMAFDEMGSARYMVDDIVEQVGADDLRSIIATLDGLHDEIYAADDAGEVMSVDYIRDTLNEPLEYLRMNDVPVDRLVDNELIELDLLKYAENATGAPRDLDNILEIMREFQMYGRHLDSVDTDHARDVLGRPFTVDEQSEVILLTAYEDAQRTWEAKGYGPDDLVSVWRTGGESNNSSVVAVTTKEGGLPDFQGNLVEYRVPRERILFDAVSLRRQLDGSDKMHLTQAEEELGVHFNDLIPVREYRPLLRQSDPTPEQMNWGVNPVFSDDRYAITLEASTFQQTQVLRAAFNADAIPTGSAVGAFPEGMPPHIQLFGGRQVKTLTEDLRLYAAAKYEDSVADVVSMTQAGLPVDQARFAEDALHLTKAEAQAAYDTGDIGPWIDEYFKTLWDLRNKSQVKRDVPNPDLVPDIGRGLSDPQSPWWDIDPMEIKAVHAGSDKLRNNDTILREGYTGEVVAFGDLSPSQGSAPRTYSDPAAMARVREIRDELQGIYDNATREGVRPGNTAQVIRDNQERIDALAAEIAEIEGKLAAKQSKRERAQRFFGTGQGTVTLNIGGRSMTVPGFRSELPGMKGRLWEQASSADETARLTYDPSGRASAAVARARASSQVEIIDRYEPNYWPELAYVGQLFRDDPLLRKILTEPKAAVVAWLKTEDGRAYARAMGKEYLGVKRKTAPAPKRPEIDPTTPAIADTTRGKPKTGRDLVEESTGPIERVDTRDGTAQVLVSEARHIDDLYNIVYSYFPTKAVRDRLASGDRGVGAAELRAMLSREDELAVVASGRGEYADEKVIGKWFDRALDRLWKLAQSMPETRVSRHPFMNRQMKINLERQANLLEQQGVKVTTKQVEGMRQAALREALDEMDKTYYNIRRYNQGAYSARFLTSFPGAFFNSLYRYGRFAVVRPEEMYFTGLLAGDIMRVFGTDSEGEPITQQNISETTWLNIPTTEEQIVVFASGKDDWKEMDGGFRFPVQSLATLFVDYPGPSWLVSMTMNQFMKMFPEFDETTQQVMGPLYEEYFPFGPQAKPSENLLGAYQKDAKRAIQGPDNTEFALTAIQFHANNMAVWERNLETDPYAPEPKMQDAIDDAYSFHTARAVKKAFAPVTISDTVPGDYMRQAWYEFKATNPGDTSEDRAEFMRLHGDWARWYTYSASSYTAYLPASQDAYQLIWRDHPDLVEEIVSNASSDEVIGIVSLLTTGVDETFSTAVNNYFKNNPLPGDDEPLSSRMTVAEFDNRVQVADGWDIYTRNRVKYDAQLENLRELRDGADNQERRQYFSDLIKEEEKSWRDWMETGPLGSNNAWKIDKSTNTNKRTVADSVLGIITTDKKFMSTTGKSVFWQTVKTFVKEEREALAKYKDLSRDAKGEFRAEFREWVRDTLVADAPEFGPIFERYYGAQWDPNDESLNELLKG